MKVGAPFHDSIQENFERYYSTQLPVNLLLKKNTFTLSEFLYWLAVPYWVKRVLWYATYQIITNNWFSLIHCTPKDMKDCLCSTYINVGMVGSKPCKASHNNMVISCCCKCAWAAKLSDALLVYSRCGLEEGSWGSGPDRYGSGGCNFDVMHCLFRLAWFNNFPQEIYVLQFLNNWSPFLF